MYEPLFAWIVIVSVSSTIAGLGGQPGAPGQIASKVLGLKSSESPLTVGAPKRPFWSWTFRKLTVEPLKSP